MLRQRADRPGVTTGKASQVSAHHAAAVVLMRGRAGLDDFSDEAVAEPAIRELAQRLVFVEDDSFGIEQAEVTVELDSMRRFVRRVDAPRGGIARPLSDTELEGKLRALVEHGGSSTPVEQLIDAVWNMDSAASAGAVIAMAGR